MFVQCPDSLLLHLGASRRCDSYDETACSFLHQDLQNSTKGYRKGKENKTKAKMLQWRTYGGCGINKKLHHIFIIKKLSLLMLNAALINGVLTGSGQPLGMDARGT